MDIFRPICCLVFGVMMGNVLLWSQVDTVSNHSTPLLLNGNAEPSSAYVLQNQLITDTNKNTIIHLLSGIKYVVIELTPEEQQKADMEEYPIIYQLVGYFQEIGFKEVAYKTEDKTRLFLNVPTYCDLIRVRFNMTSKETYFENVQLRLQTCRNDYYTFTYKEKFYKNENFLQNLYSIFLLFHKDQISYDVKNRLKLPSNSVVTTKEKVLTYFKENAFSVDSIEGIFEKIPYYYFNKKKHTVAIIKNTDGNYDIVYLDSASNHLDWQEGEWMGEIKSAANGGKFEDVKWITPDKMVQMNGSISLKGENTFLLQFANHRETYAYQRLDSTVPLTDTPSLEGRGVSGTGILVDKRGYILTHYKVVENATKITIVLPKTEEQSYESWSAQLIAADEQLGLALLQINNTDTPRCDFIPYLIAPKESNIGEKVFTLGYPLVASMGMHPKLAVGSISSVYGYKNVTSTYQTTVQVYAGNSGSPLFDYEGRLVGMIKNKHTDAVKVSYALKSSSILQFLEKTNLFEVSELTDNSTTMQGEPLTKQIKQLQPFIYYIYSY